MYICPFFYTCVIISEVPTCIYQLLDCIYCYHTILQNVVTMAFSPAASSYYCFLRSKVSCSKRWIYIVLSAFLSVMSIDQYVLIKLL